MYDISYKDYVRLVEMKFYNMYVYVNWYLKYDNKWKVVEELWLDE